MAIRTESNRSSRINSFHPYANDSSTIREEISRGISKTKVYVGNLPYNCSELDLKEIINEKTAISYKILTQMDGRSKGSALIEFSTKDAADYAINKYNGTEFNGRILAVKLDRPPPHAQNGRNDSNYGEESTTTVFVGNLAWSVSWQDLKDFMRATGDVAHAEVAQTQDGKSRGFGYVKYWSKGDAINAVGGLNGMDLKGCPIMLSLGESNLNQLGQSGQQYSAQQLGVSGGGYDTQWMNPNNIPPAMSQSNYMTNANANNNSYSNGQQMLGYSNQMNNMYPYPNQQAANPYYNRGPSTGTTPPSSTDNIETKYQPNMPANQSLGYNRMAGADSGMLPINSQNSYHTIDPTYNPSGIGGMGGIGSYPSQPMAMKLPSAQSMSYLGPPNNFPMRGDFNGDYRSRRGGGGPIRGRGRFNRDYHDRGSLEKNSQSGSSSSHSSTGLANRVYVNCLAWAVTVSDLKEHFEQVGNVVLADVFQTEDGRSKGCGLVEFSDPACATIAITKLSGTSIKGRPIYVREDRVGNRGSSSNAATHNNNNNNNDVV